MQNVAFIVNTQLEEGENLLDVAQDIQDAVEAEGFVVVSVAPHGGPLRNAELGSYNDFPVQ